MGINITPSVAADAAEQVDEKIADDIEVLPGGTVIDNPQDVAWLRSYYELSSITAKFAEQFVDAHGDEAVRALMGRHRATPISPGAVLEPVSTTPTTAPTSRPSGRELRILLRSSGSAPPCASRCTSMRPIIGDGAVRPSEIRTLAGGRASNAGRRANTWNASSRVSMPS
jgi:hypothetical protein